MCHNASNPEGLGAFLNCSMVCKDQTGNIKEDTLINEYKWTQEMIDMRNEVPELCKTHPVFEIYGGLTSEMQAAMGEIGQATMVCSGNSITRTQCCEEYGRQVDFLIGEISDKLNTVKETGEFDTEES